MQAMAAGLDRETLQGVDDGGAVADDGIPGHHAGEHERDPYIEDRADDEGRNDADGHVALRILALLTGCGDGVEADVGEEDDGAASEYAGEAVRHKGVVVAGVDEPDAEEHKGKDGGNFDQHHEVVGARGLADTDDEHDRDEEDDEEGRDIEAGMPADGKDVLAGEILQALRQKGGGEPFGVEPDVEPVEQIDDVRGEPDRDAHVGKGVLEDKVPADDPGDELAERGIGIGVGGARDGDHAGELGVAKPGKRADNRHEHK